MKHGIVRHPRDCLSSTGYITMQTVAAWNDYRGHLIRLTTLKSTTRSRQPRTVWQRVPDHHAGLAGAITTFELEEKLSTLRHHAIAERDELPLVLTNLARPLWTTSTPTIQSPPLEYSSLRNLLLTWSRIARCSTWNNSKFTFARDVSGYYRD